MAENLVRSSLISRIFNGFPIACFRLFIFIIFFYYRVWKPGYEKSWRCSKIMNVNIAAELTENLRLFA